MYRIILSAYLFVVLSFGPSAYAKENAQASPPAPGATQEEALTDTPGLADLVLKAAELSRRLTDLEESLEKIADPAAAENSFRSTEARLNTLSSRLGEMKTAETAGYYQLVQLKTALEEERNFLERNLKPVTAGLRKASASKREWSKEKKQWSRWQASLDEDLQITAVQSTFAKAEETIAKARTTISRHLEPLLAAEIRGGELETRIYSMISKVNDLIVYWRDVVSTETSPPMFSSQYVAQFGPRLWHELRGGIRAVVWPDRQFFARQGWIMGLQVFLALASAALMRRSRKSLEESDQFRLLAGRPFAVGVIISLITLTGLYRSFPPTLSLFVRILGFGALARVTAVYTTRSADRWLIYGLALMMITTQFFVVISLPLPLFRLYVFIVASAGFTVCLVLARQHHRQKESPGYVTFGLGLLSLLFLIVALLQMSGQADRALRVLDAFFVTVGFALGAWLLMQLVRGALNWVVHTPRFQNISVFQKHGSIIAARVALLFDFFIVWLFVLTVLLNWQVFSTPAEAIKGVLSWGFTMGSQRVTIGLLLAAIAILYGSVVVSSTVQTLLLEEVFPKRNIEPGVGLSIFRLTQYGLLSVGFLLALATLGISLTNLTILGGALGVGIGFGLQAIVNNFASGLILLFERPIRVHDYIVVGDLFAEIKSIGLRSTVVRTFNGSEIVIPNSDLITNQVTNWTLSERHMRLKIQVGVAYGSDVALVKETLIACAAGNAWVLNTPAPTVLFLNFGESSLDFELRLWIANVDHMMSVASSIRFAIDQRFRDAGIEISFPQRDLHIRSVDESAGQILSRSEEHRSDPVANPKNEKT